MPQRRGGKRALDRQLYDALLQAFREAPSNISRAATNAHCTFRLAKKAWEFGWKQFEWARPIRTVLLEEQQEARAEKLRIATEQRAKADDVRVKARQDSIEVTAQEGMAVERGRAMTVAFTAVMANLIKGAVPLSQRINQLANTDPSQFEPKETMRMLAQVAYMLKQGVTSIQTVMELERQRLGEPLAAFQTLAPVDEGLDAGVEAVGNIAALLQGAVDRGHLPPEFLRELIGHIPANISANDSTTNGAH